MIYSWRNGFAPRPYHAPPGNGGAKPPGNGGAKPPGNGGAKPPGNGGAKPPATVAGTPNQWHATRRDPGARV